jgi:hypothetical protein
MDLTLLLQLSFFTFGLLYPNYILEIILMYVFTHINDCDVFDDTGIHCQNQLLIACIIYLFSPAEQ